MYCKLSSFLVVGLKKSGVAVCKLLALKGATVYAFDNSATSAQNAYDELVGLGVQMVGDAVKTLEIVDVVVLSPAVPIDHEISVLAKSMKKRVIGEMELSSLFLTSPIIGVTGTNGKTTTCSLISHILSENKVENSLLGNVGTPLSTYFLENKNSELVVLEISSFQLETIYSLTPHIACVLNVTPDHLDRHYNMDNYTFLKKKLLLNLRESEFAVLNYEDEIVKTFANETRAKTIWFSSKQKVDGGYLENNKIYYFDEFIANLEDLSLFGEHMIENFLASLCVLKLLGLDSSEILKGLSNFKGVKHRLESVANVGGVEFINDSKSTNASSCITAIRAVKKPTTLIIGGYEKGLDYSALMREIKNSQFIKSLVITGKSARRMYETAVKEDVENVSLVSDFTCAIKVANLLTKSGETVLFSPATSSFDLFLDFEERGDKFVQVVKSL